MHSLLESYLAEVTAQLSALPAKQRADELREMRAHLLNVFAAHCERGQSEDEAARDTIAQFGTPEAVGQETVTAWQRGEALSKRSLWGAFACSLTVMFLLPRVIDPTAIAYFNSLDHNHYPLWAFPLIFAWFFLTPSLGGGISGVLFPKRAVAGTGLATAVYFGFNFVMVAYWLAGEVLSSADRFTIDKTLVLRFLVSGLIAVASAWAGSRWQKARMGRERLARS